MASDHGTGSHPPDKEEGATAAAGAGFDDLEDTWFQCCVCLKLLHKPVVIACGHMSCFWCVHKAMHGFQGSHCAICSQPYNHFPSICQLLHHLLLKLEPVKYKRREKEVLEDEKRVDTYSPQIIEFLNYTNNNCENGEDWENRLDKTGPPEEVSTGDIINEHTKKVKLEDVSCSLCKELLYQPAVLNCGHVYCMSCLPSFDDEALKCQVCGSLHPGDFPKVCLDLNHFIEEYFPAEYELRREEVEFKKSQYNLEGSSSGTSCTKQSSSRPSKKDTCVQLNEDLFNVHFGVGCDSCGVYPMKGKRYKCKDCTELIGFDLCEECYNTRSKLPGRFNQQHTPDHRMELDNTALLGRVMGLGGPVGMMGAFVAPGIMVPIIPDDHDMEDNGAFVAPGIMVPVPPDDHDMEDNGGEGQLL